MRRREFIAALGGAAAWPLARGRAATENWRVGFLSPVFPPAKSPGEPRFLKHFAKGTLGYVEGKNLVIECRYAEGQSDRLPAFAIELVSLPCDAM